MLTQTLDFPGLAATRPMRSFATWAVRVSLVALGLFIIWFFAPVVVAAGQNAYQRQPELQGAYQGAASSGVVPEISRADTSTGVSPKEDASSSAQSPTSAPSSTRQGSDSQALAVTNGLERETTSTSPSSTNGNRPVGEDPKMAQASSPIGAASPPIGGAQTGAGALSTSIQAGAAQAQTSPQARTTNAQPNTSPARDAQPVALSGLEQGMLEALNQRRAKAGLPPVVADLVLTQVARQRSNDMAVKNYFSHTAPDGSSFIDGLRARGITAGTVGEILGRNNASDDLSVSMVADAFMNSPSHRLHVVYPSYQWAGIGVARGVDGMKYYTIIYRGA